VKRINVTVEFSKYLKLFLFLDFARITMETTKHKTIKLRKNLMYRTFGISPLSEICPSINPHLGINEEPTTLSMNKYDVLRILGF
jgi:hypothetical protein